MRKHASEALCPVSRKFYTYISDRVRESMRLTGHEEAIGEAMASIDRYLADGSIPSEDADPAVRLTFALLRPEIDKAIERSKPCTQTPPHSRKVGRKIRHKSSLSY